MSKSNANTESSSVNEEREVNPQVDSTSQPTIANFLRKQLVRMNRIVYPGIHTLYNENYKCTSPMDKVIKLFKPTLRSENSPKTRTITTLSLSEDVCRLYVGFQKGYFITLNARTLELLPQYETPTESVTLNPINKIFENTDRKIYVSIRNKITQYQLAQFEYDFRFHLDTKAQAVLSLGEKMIAIDKAGKFYNLSHYLPAFDGVMRNLRLSRDIDLQPIYHMGRITRVVQLKSSTDGYYPLLVQHNQNIGIVCIQIEPATTVNVWVQRIGLITDPRNDVQIRCSGTEYFYATIHNGESDSDQKIYYNQLELIGTDHPDSILEVHSGSVSRINTYNDLLVVDTTERHIEIFCLITYVKMFDIDVGFPIRRSIVYKNSLVAVSKEGFLLSKPLPMSNHSCCDHCLDLFKLGDFWRVCTHYLPRRPPTNDEQALRLIGIR